MQELVDIIREGGTDVAQGWADNIDTINEHLPSEALVKVANEAARSAAALTFRGMNLAVIFEGLYTAGFAAGIFIEKYRAEHGPLTVAPEALDVQALLAEIQGLPELEPGPQPEATDEHTEGLA